jgi:hypothetical protein
MRLFLFVATATLLLTAAPAEACMAEPLPQAVVFDSPPAHRPPGYGLFRVVGRTVDHDRERLLVSVLEPAQARRLGPLAWLQAAPMSSCTTWGRLGAEGYVVARVAGTLRGRALLAARIYARSWLDRLWDVFGSETYRASGQPL